MIPVRLYQERPQSTMSGLNAPGGAGCFPTPRVFAGEQIDAHGLNAPGGAGCFPTPRRVVRCPAWGNGPRIATGPKAPLDRAAHRPLKQTLPSSRKGRHRRASKGSAPPDVDVGMRIRGAVPCSSDTSVQTWAVNREALARRPPGECGRVVGEGRRRTRGLGDSRPRLSGWRAPWGRRCRRGAMPPAVSWVLGAGPCSWALRRRLPAAGVACWCGCYTRDSVVSMEIASLTRRPRVRVTDVMGSEPIVWNSLSVRSPAGA